MPGEAVPKEQATLPTLQRQHMSGSLALRHSDGLHPVFIAERGYPSLYHVS